VVVVVVFIIVVVVVVVVIVGTVMNHSHCGGGVDPRVGSDDRGG